MAIIAIRVFDGDGRLKRGLPFYSLVAITISVSIACSFSATPTAIPPTAMTKTPTLQQGSADARIHPNESLVLVYIEPNESSDYLTVLSMNDPLMVLERTADDRWIKVRTTDNLEGWVLNAQLIVEIELANVPAIAVPTPPSAITPPVADIQPATLEGEVWGASRTNLQTILKRGIARGNRVEVFSKIGDSITESVHFLAPFGDKRYDLQGYAYLQPAIDYFSQGIMYNDRNPFNATPIAAKRSWTSATVLDPDYANPQFCQAGESPLECDYAAIAPIVALIMFGTNDVSSMSADTFRRNMSEIIEISIDYGIIPVISTIPQRDGYAAKVREFNAVIVDLADKYDIPLWDYAALMSTLPNQGLSSDGAHPSFPQGNTTAAATFSFANLQYGYTVRNLSALEILYSLLSEVIQPTLTGN